MEARAVKLGNSLAFTIPKQIANKCGLVESSSVDITLRGDEIMKNRDRQILLDIPPQPNLQHARPFTPPRKKATSIRLFQPHTNVPHHQ